LKWVKPWQAKRLMWNAFSFTREQEQETEKMKGRIDIDLGEYDPVLGYSYGEIAGMSRSMHKSQGMGTFERKGMQKNSLVTLAGDVAVHDVFDGIDITWSRVRGGDAVGSVLNEACREFQDEHPEKVVPLLLQARAKLADMHDVIAERKRKDLDDAIALASGLAMDATADKYEAVPGGSFKITRTVINRESVPMQWNGKDLSLNAPATVTDNVPILASEPYSQPYWLREPKQGDTYTVSDQLLIGLADTPPVVESEFRVRVDGQEIDYKRGAIYRWADRVLGERERPLEVVPPVAVNTPAKAILFPNGSARDVEVELEPTVAAVSGELRVEAPDGWKIEPATRSFQIGDIGQEAVLRFHVSPPSADAHGALKASVDAGGRTVAVGMETIDYPHIPPQVLFPPADTKLVRADVKLLSKNIGYVMGAGDEVPDSLRQLGAQVTLLTPDDLVKGDLSRYDAIVTGVRAYNTRPDLRANEQRLLDYMQNGGTVVVQYNTAEGGFGGERPSPALAHVGPYPMTISHDRVTVEEAPMKFVDESSPLLHRPNEITERDFEGWIQERGLYFASKWAPEYHALFETHDPNEKPLLGSTLWTPYGKGAYVFTGLSFFRELPAGVPGAYRLFANFLSAGK